MSRSDLQILGVDCATNPRKVGLARASWRNGAVRLVEAELGPRTLRELVQRLGSWLADAPATLLALDAPLGWPSPLGAALDRHRAGAPIEQDPHALFRRHTDRFLKQHIGRQPLDVGADRIARTAHAALRLLGDLCDATRQEIPLAWSPKQSSKGATAIEVYPAATLTVHGLHASNYKKPTQVSRRSAILRALEAHLEVPAELHTVLLKNADVLDAAVCVLAAKDFLAGHAFPPPDPETAELEGWIWVRRPLAKPRTPRAPAPPAHAE